MKLILALMALCAPAFASNDAVYNINPQVFDAPAFKARALLLICDPVSEVCTTNVEPVADLSIIGLVNAPNPKLGTDHCYDYHSYTFIGVCWFSISITTPTAGSYDDCEGCQYTKKVQINWGPPGHTTDTIDMSGGVACDTIFSSTYVHPVTPSCSVTVYHGCDDSC